MSRYVRPIDDIELGIVAPGILGDGIGGQVRFSRGIAC